MGIGVSIFLLALGAVLAFAVEASISGLDIQVIGFILMAAGVLGLVLTMSLFSRTRTTTAAPVVTEERVIRDRDVY